MRYAYLAPAGALLLAVIALPAALTLAGSMGHYAEAFSDRDFAESAVTTVRFAAVTTAIEMALGLLFAVLLHETFRLRGWVRAIALIPWALPTAVMAMSWKYIFNDLYGVANDLLVRCGLIAQPLAWLGDANLAFWALVVADVWKTTPFVTIILLAGLQTIPRDLYEAMNIDGGGPVRRFLWVTLPLLRPALALALTFRIIHAMGIFDLIQVVTEGGPGNATKTVALYIYQNLITFQRPDYGAALTVIFAVGVFALAAGAGALVRGRAR